ncbi:hypothetical protein VYU27_010514, partial [Nannochloropsis oceanica]
SISLSASPIFGKPCAPSAYNSNMHYVVAFYDAFACMEDATVALMVEYMDGGSLQDIVDSGGCQHEKTLAAIAYQSLLGLSFIHQCHQLHRDIKPANMLINRAGEVKISDFGIVRRLDEEEEEEEEGEEEGGREGGPRAPPTLIRLGENAQTFVGTVTYMSPERIDGQDYSYASDVW